MTRGFAHTPFKPSGHIIISGTIIRATEKAILLKMLEISGLALVQPKDEWFPLSQILNIKRSPPSDVASTDDSISVTEWIYGAKDLSKLPRKAPQDFMDTEDPPLEEAEHDDTPYNELDPDRDIPW